MQRILFFFVILIFGGLHFALMSYWYPSVSDSRDIMLAHWLASQDSTPVSPQYDAARFCLDVAQRRLEDVDCRTGLALTRGDAVVDLNNMEAFAKANEFIAWRLERMQTLGTAWESLLETQRLFTVPLLALSVKIDQAKASSTVSSDPELKSGKRVDESYSVTFNRLLELDGVVYRSIAGTFASKRWDITRIIHEPEDIIRRGWQLEMALRWGGLAMTLSSMILIATALRVGGIFPACVLAAFQVLLSLGLIIKADAAVNFGNNSTFFAFSPLINQLYRDLAIVILLDLLLLACLLFQDFLRAALGWCERFREIVPPVSVLFVLAGYVLLGPSVGSETLKLFVAVNSALLLVYQGRALHLAGKYANQIFTFRSVVENFKWSTQQETHPKRLFISALFRPLLGYVVCGVISIFCAALLFKDLGGASVAVLLMIATIYLTFGIRLTAAITLSSIALASPLLLTDKIQERLSLMLTPMTAHVSDFARLLAFSDAAGPTGFGLGNIPWCNENGVCLPIQVLSDYMPVILTGAGGAWFGIAIYIVLSVLFGGLAGISLWRFITGPGPDKLIHGAAFFLLTAVFIQTNVTFLGNWRIIPLTGLGVPLLSIGVSSILTPVIGLLFFIVGGIKVGKVKNA